VLKGKLGFFVKIKEDENFNHPGGIGCELYGASADIGEKDGFR
jgi:hypothetical protein